MKGSWLCGALVAAMVAFPAAWSGAADDAAAKPAKRAEGARIEVDSLDYSFGRVPNDRAVEHVFKVSNTGTKPLVITRVQTSCGCTAAMMESSVVDPGKAGRLRVSFNPHGQKQVVTRTISIYSNDPVDSVLQVKLTANVVPAGEEKKPEPPVVRTHNPKLGKLVFGAECLKCHGPKSADESGMALYVSACQACHGAAGVGNRIGLEVIGPPLKVGAMNVKTAAGIRQVIAAGTGHPAMPGYGKEYGGMLSDRQVDSLVQLILKSFPTR